mmetsp:Transcript_7756/g.16954  ORF Transcript_7756/g.16954 Transcript_7756/m.16954 type:complete len:308 (-) Transcript_7756:26-949(-)
MRLWERSSRRRVGGRPFTSWMWLFARSRSVRWEKRLSVIRSRWVIRLWRRRSSRGGDRGWGDAGGGNMCTSSASVFPPLHSRSTWLCIGHCTYRDSNPPPSSPYPYSCLFSDPLLLSLPPVPSNSRGWRCCRASGLASKYSVCGPDRCGTGDCCCSLAISSPLSKSKPPPLPLLSAGASAIAGVGAGVGVGAGGALGVPCSIFCTYFELKRDRDFRLGVGDTSGDTATGTGAWALSFPSTTAFSSCTGTHSTGCGRGDSALSGRVNVTVVTLVGLMRVGLGGPSTSDLGSREGDPGRVGPVGAVGGA